MLRHNSRNILGNTLENFDQNRQKAEFLALFVQTYKNIALITNVKKKLLLEKSLHMVS